MLVRHGYFLNQSQTQQVRHIKNVFMNSITGSRSILTFPWVALHSLALCYV